MRHQLVTPVMCIAGALLVSACGTMTYDPRANEEKSPSATMASTTAVHNIRALLAKSHVAYEAGPAIQDETFAADHFTLVITSPYDKSEKITCTLKYGGNIPLRVWRDGMIFFVQHFYDHCGRLHWHNQDEAVSFSDALARLETLSLAGKLKTEEEDLQEFQKIAADYRAANPRPALPEDAHRFQVLAENAFDEKRYTDSIDYYDKGLAISPWWPNGHYNRALLLAKLNNFQDAIAEMKRYLALEPDAKDSREARDKMYIWEGRVEKGVVGEAKRKTY